ncbi:MAG: hypothetical protein ACE5OZ_14040 [Candidatus Heimdallarchaeota archaeon]
MVDFDKLCTEILIAVTRNHQRYLDLGNGNLEMQHKFLTQTAIIQQLWTQVHDQRGYRNKELLARAFREMEQNGWIESREGKQNAYLYFPTELGMKTSGDAMTQDLTQVKCFIDGANVAYHPNRSAPTLANVKLVLQELREYFGFKPISFHVVWKPAIRHRLSEDEHAEFEKLEKQGLIVQSFRGRGATDDQMVLMWADDFKQTGQEVWIVTNDRYQDHWENFPWFKEFPNKIEFRILGDHVKFDPPEPGAPKGTVAKETEKTAEKVPALENIPVGELKLVKMSQMPKDPEALELRNLDEFLEMAKVSQIDQIFFSADPHHPGSVARFFWFMHQGKLVQHPLNPAFSELDSLQRYIEARTWHLQTEEQYNVWIEQNLKEKGYPGFIGYKSFISAIKTDKSNLGSRLGRYIRPQFNDTVQEQWVQVQAENRDRIAPPYEPCCIKEETWHLWLIAQQNGWPSLKTLITTWYDLLDLDLLAEKPSFCNHLLSYLMCQPYDEVHKIANSHEFRKTLWQPYWFAPSPSANNPVQGIFGHHPDPIANATHEELKTGNFDAYGSITDLPLSRAQAILAVVAQRQGWESYEDLLETGKKHLSTQFWQELNDQAIQQSGNLDRYSPELRARLHFSWHSLVTENGQKFARGILIALAKLTPQAAQEFNIEADPRTKTLDFKIGDQKFGEAGKEGRGRRSF